MERSPHQGVKNNRLLCALQSERLFFVCRGNRTGSTGPYWKHIHKQEGFEGSGSPMMEAAAKRPPALQRVARALTEDRQERLDREACRVLPL